MTFTWNHKKNINNIKNHGLSFELASRVFLDPNRFEIYDDLHSIYEDRYITIGFINDVPITVVYTPLPDDRIRIISAWRASKEQLRYYTETWRAII